MADFLAGVLTGVLALYLSVALLAAWRLRRDSGCSAGGVRDLVGLVAAGLCWWILFVADADALDDDDIWNGGV